MTEKFCNRPPVRNTIVPFGVQYNDHDISSNPVSTYKPANFYAMAPTKTITAEDGRKYTQTLIQTPQQLAFCNDEVSTTDPASVSLNQRLSQGFCQGMEQGLNQGVSYSMGHNPVTDIPPLVVPPSHALDYWKENNLIVHSAINSEGYQKDMYLSGYAESTCCDYLGSDAELVPLSQYTDTIIGGNIQENYCSGNPNRYPAKGRPINSPVPVEDIPYIPRVSENYCSGNLNVYPAKGKQIVAPLPVEDIPYIPRVSENYCSGNPYKYPAKGRPIVAPTPVEDRVFIPSMGRVRENFDKTTIRNAQPLYIQPDQPGWVNTECGYNPEQVNRSGLPSNLPAGNCEQNPLMKQYNENLFTSTVTPGVYTRNQVNEPINANIGISFQQQFEPVSCEMTDKGLMYLQHDPRIIEPAKMVDTKEMYPKASFDNVFDPRFYGYGTSYRSYIDPVVGQPRFMYDDINAIRMSNYVTRSKVDHLPYCDSYGPIQEESQMGNIHNPHLRSLVQDSYLRDSLQFRNDLTERQMRKINSELPQRRSAPFGARMVGSNKH